MKTKKNGACLWFFEIGAVTPETATNVLFLNKYRCAVKINNHPIVCMNFISVTCPLFLLLLT